MTASVSVSHICQCKSLPCARGGGPPQGGSEGLSDNPPVSAYALPAPFAQGGLLTAPDIILSTLSKHRTAEGEAQQRAQKVRQGLAY